MMSEGSELNKTKQPIESLNNVVQWETIALHLVNTQIYKQITKMQSFCFHHTKNYRLVKNSQKIFKTS